MPSTKLVLLKVGVTFCKTESSWLSGRGSHGEVRQDKAFSIHHPSLPSPDLSLPASASPTNIIKRGRRPGLDPGDKEEEKEERKGRKGKNKRKGQSRLEGPP